MEFRVSVCTATLGLLIVWDECKKTSYTARQSVRKTSYTARQYGTECPKTSYTARQYGIECRKTSSTARQSVRRLPTNAQPGSMGPSVGRLLPQPCRQSVGSLPIQPGGMGQSVERLPTQPGRV